MSPFKKILLCVHPEITDLNVVDHAARTARECSAQVRVMHTISDYPEDIGEWWNVRNPKQLKKQIIKERQAYLDEILEYLRDFGVEGADTRIRWGTPAMEIVQEVLENGQELVIITASQKSRFAKRMLDCPSLELMRHCPATIWIAQGKIAKRYRRIAVALGDVKGDLPGDGVNERVLETAALLARAENSELHVIHVLPVYGAHHPDNQKNNELSHSLRERHQMVRDMCLPVLEKSGKELVDERIHIPVGSPPALQIKDVIKAQKISLAVMGTTMGNRDKGIFLGSTSEKVFTHTKVSVVSVKPTDFESKVAKQGMGG